MNEVPDVMVNLYNFQRSDALPRWSRTVVSSLDDTGTNVNMY